MTAVAVAAWLILAAFSAAHAVMYKRKPRSAAIWLFVSFALPFAGPWLYWVLGINRIERRARKHLHRRYRFSGAPGIAEFRDAADGKAESVGHLVSLRTVADRVTRLPLLSGNTIKPLDNGEEAYPAMLEAIAKAEQSVTLESYIFDWDEIGREFVHALGQASQRGVSVHALLDGIGAVGSLSRVGRRLLKADAEVAAFFPFRLRLAVCG